jgi:uncharacterized membrane protein YhaH (DUF805 family)
MAFVRSAMATLRKYADFKGRASRQEFWTFFAFVLIAQALARLVDAVLFPGSLLAGPVSSLTGLVLFIPQVAVTVRRLHDVGKSGKELLVPLLMLFALPIVAWAALGGFIGKIVLLGYGGVLMLIFAHLLLSLIKKGGTVPNKYGSAPTAFSFAD